MKVAFVGKGGSGKTTLSSLFIRHLHATGLPVVAVDADINQHLGTALGLSDESVAPPLGDHLALLKDHLRGDNPRIGSAATMVKTTPPGRGSRLLHLFGRDPFHTDLALDVAPGLKLLATGPFTDDDLGVACYHSKTGAVELYLNHLVDGPGEYVVVDMTAGADTFASGLFTRFDVLFLVAEPTRKGVSVYRQYTDYARDYDVTIKVVGNKVHDEQDVDYLREHVGADLLTWFGHSPAVRAIEQGREGAALEEAGIASMDVLRKTVDEQVKDWGTYLRQAAEFHVKNARSWANRATGEDLAAQVDPEFAFPA
ncbi:CO dehydrogenase maturation factor [Actinocorallia herbida]|uniref:CO dehydrogenase maturation factor n=1 Tax=Actinocorallia herbida TaxID=58109 RepID=A0A3N1D7I9_9ACTN|nr:ATP-binding protein [Actinocorallia herbida]ROO89503.1 CO dehydrogenase maturation factor [Actinocorallia herbida]